MFAVVLKNHQTWLICGGREFNDSAIFDAAMGDLCTMRGCPSRVIHGHASGADALAHSWAHKMALDVDGIVPDWKTHGKAAGPLRNQQMLDDFKPNFVIAFPGGRGTADMVERARKAGVEVAEITLK